MESRPDYMDRNSKKTLREGLAEYYALNPHISPPETQPAEFAKILLAHDVGHVIYGCDTGMYDELKILPLFWWTSECTFKTYVGMRKSHAHAVNVMYEDMITNKGVLWLYGAVLRVIPALTPELIRIWFKTRNWRKRLPFLEFEPLLERSLLDIRQEFDLLKFMKL